jgi:tripartite-type tricarboxylate transporter receptor subunit TctC
MFARLFLVALAITLVSPRAFAEAFPTKPLTLIVGVAPGGTLDTLARLLARSMSKELRQNILVENITGAGGLVGLKRLMQSEPDGHTLMFTNMSLVIIPHLHPTANINPAKELDPIGQVATVPMVLSVSNASGVTSLPELLDKMRKNPGKANFGSGGPGTTAHLAEALFMHLSKTKGELVQYRGSGPAIADLMAGAIDAVIDQTVTMMPLHKTQKIRSIAIATERRIPQMPDVATFAEGGLPGFDLAIWNGVMAPKGVPTDVIKRLAESLSRAIDSPEFKHRLEELAAQPPGPAERGPAPLRKLLERDSAMVADLVRHVGLIPR